MWAAEANNKASEVYGGVTKGEELSENYISKNQEVIKRQIVLGGYRLAHVISSIFGSKSFL
jgi:hypothetical protein